MPTVNEIINIGFTNHQEGRLDEAETAYNEALKLDGENADVCNLMGVLKLQQGDVEAGIEWVEKAVSLKPCEYYYETLFQAYIRGSKYKELTGYADGVVKVLPKSFPLLFNLALL